MFQRSRPQRPRFEAEAGEPPSQPGKAAGSGTGYVGARIRTCTRPSVPISFTKAATLLSEHLPAGDTVKLS